MSSPVESNIKTSSRLRTPRDQHSCTVTCATSSSFKCTPVSSHQDSCDQRWRNSWHGICLNHSAWRGIGLVLPKTAGDRGFTMNFCAHVSLAKDVYHASGKIALATIGMPMHLTFRPPMMHSNLSNHTLDLTLNYNSHILS